MAAASFSFNFLTRAFQPRHVARAPFEKGAGVFLRPSSRVGSDWRSASPPAAGRALWLAGRSQTRVLAWTHRGAGLGDEHQSPSVNTGSREHERAGSRERARLIDQRFSAKDVDLIFNRSCELHEEPRHEFTSMWIFVQTGSVTTYRKLQQGAWRRRRRRRRRRWDGSYLIKFILIHLI